MLRRALLSVSETVRARAATASAARARLASGEAAGTSEGGGGEAPAPVESDDEAGKKARATNLALGRINPNRLFYPGQQYAAEDLDAESSAEFVHTSQLKAKAVRAQGKDVNLKVLAQADFRNPKYLANFTSSAGRIVPRRDSGLTKKVHRRISKEIKTARMMGLLPYGP